MRLLQNKTAHIAVSGELRLFAVRIPVESLCFFVLVEAVLQRRSRSLAGCAVFNLRENFIMLHLIGEVSAVELDLEGGFVQVLKLGRANISGSSSKPTGSK